MSKNQNIRSVKLGMFLANQWKSRPIHKNTLHLTNVTPVTTTKTSEETQLAALVILLNTLRLVANLDSVNTFRYQTTGEVPLDLVIMLTQHQQSLVNELNDDLR
jgi:hypothetical protein